MEDLRQNVSIYFFRILFMSIKILINKIPQINIKSYTVGGRKVSLIESIKFIIVGVFATIVSLFGFDYILDHSNNFLLATVTRWTILLPVLYIGYSRFVLINTLKTNQKIHGRSKAELIMFSQVALAVGGSFAVKIICEPLTTNFFIQQMGMTNAFISPILADFVYGPIVNYYILYKFNIYNKKKSQQKDSMILLRNPSDSISSSLPKKLMIGVTWKLANVFKFWKYPRKNDGCFENMSIVDKLYWIYKAQRPILYGEKRSGVEEYFKQNNNEKITLPNSFEAISSASFCGVGDLMQNDLLENSLDKLYEDIEDVIFDSDISMANLESPLTSQQKLEFVFSDKEAPPIYISQEQFHTLKGHKEKKFTVMTTACNHSYDYGLEGVTTTLERLKHENIISVGTNLVKEDQEKATIVDSKGIKIGFVAFTFGLNGKKVPKDKEYCINKTNLNEVYDDVDLTLILKQIEYCKETKCDFVVLALHWGLEYEFYPTKRQIELTHFLVEKGVDFIISHHPHVVQPVEYYRTQRDPNRIAVICYSLGNLVNPFSDEHLSVSIMIKLSFVKGYLDSELKTYIKECKIIPVYQEIEHVEGVPQIRLKKISKSDLKEDNSIKKSILEIFGDKIDYETEEEFQC